MSSNEPSTGTSPATLTIAVSDSSDTYAIASSSCSSRPAGLARLLVEVHRRVAALLDERAEVAQQRGLARVGGLPVAGGRDLVDPDARLARRARVHGEPGWLR